MADQEIVQETESQCNCPGMNRRKFLSIAGWGAFLATIGVSLVASIRFLFPRVLFEPPMTFKIGFPDDFVSEEKPDKMGVVFINEKWKDSQRVWIVREEKKLYAMFTRCTHLGCTPNWFEEDGIFKCPCHGSQYRSNGVNFAGPAPRPLDRFAITIAGDGKIMVDKTKLYSNKDFDNPGSFVEV